MIRKKEIKIIQAVKIQKKNFLMRLMINSVRLRIKIILKWHKKPGYQ